MKKLVLVITSIVLLFGTVSAVAETTPEYKNIKITVNGEKIILLNSEDEQQKSVIIDGQVYVPIEPFITAVGGEYSYDEAGNQIVINLQQSSAAEPVEFATGENSAAGGYSDKDIAGILTMGRWTRSSEQGKTFFDFYENYTGIISGLIECKWTVNNGIVALDYESRGTEYHVDYTLEIVDGQFRLSGEPGTFVLNADLENRDILIGKWTAVSDETVTLTLLADASFELKIYGKTFSGNWIINKDQTAFCLYQPGGESITGSINGTNIALEVEGRYISFKR